MAGLLFKHIADQFACKWAFFLGAFLIGMPTIATSQTASFGPFDTYPEHSAILLSGPIEYSSADDFQRALQAVGDIEFLLLASPGGSVAAALEIGEEVSLRRLTTLVPENAICASACALVYFSGTRRIAIGELGVHQMSSNSTDALSGVQFLLAEVLTAFDRFGVDARVIQRMLRTSPEDMYYFDETEKLDLGITRYTEPTRALLKSSFSDYPAEVYSGELAYPDFVGRDSWARTYRTRIREGIDGGANFAGRFAVVEIGCGTSCRFAYVADVTNGEVFGFPYGGEEQYQLGLVYAADSSLIRATWRDMSKGYDPVTDKIECVSQDLEWSDNSFRIISEERWQVLGWECSLEY